MGDQETDMAEEKAEEKADHADEAGTYELDLESGDDPEEAMRSALDAVEKKRHRKTIPIDGPDGDDGNGTGGGDPEDDAASGSTDGAAKGEDGVPGQENAAVLKERLLRTLADFDNYRKRTEREMATLKRFAVTDVLKDMLGVVDNLERAAAASGTIEELKQGLDMILRQQSEVMKRFGVEPIDAAGKAFDPTLHEAVAREDSTDVETPTVIRELQKGYTIHDRLLRPSMVHVAMPAAGVRSGGGGDSAEDRDESDGSE